MFPKRFLALRISRSLELIFKGADAILIGRNGSLYIAFLLVNALWDRVKEIIKNDPGKRYVSIPLKARRAGEGNRTLAASLEG